MQANTRIPKYRPDGELSVVSGESFNSNHRRNSRWWKRWLTMALLSIVGWTASGVSAAEDGSWPMFQGNPAHTGYVPVSLNPTNFALLWQTTINAGVALNPVTEGDGKVFVSEIGYFTDVGLYALSATNGSVLWSVDYGDIYSLNPPSYGYGNVYIENGNGIGGGEVSGAGLSAYQAGTGAAVFRSPIGAQWERYLAPTLFNGNVYVDGGYYGGMYSFNATNGTQNWFGYVAQYDGWTPAVDSNYCYAFTGSGDETPITGQFCMIDRFSGRTDYLVTDNNFVWDGYTMYGTVVLGAHNDAFAIDQSGTSSYSGSGSLLMFDLRSDGTNTPHIGWALTGSFIGQPTIANNVLYVNDGGILVAFDELTGSRLWAWGAASAGSLTGTIVATDNLLFVGTGTTTYAIDLGSHQAVWSYPVSGDLAWGDGVLYVAGASGTLTAIGAPADAVDPVSNPGGPYTVECRGASTTVQLDGSASSDPAGHTLTFYWSSDSAAATFSDPFNPAPILTIDATAAVGCMVTLTVNDGQHTNSAQALVTVVDTTPPTIQCGTNKVVQPGKVWSFDVPVASDACSGTNLTITVVGTITNVNGCAVDITRTWQATDGSGNSSQGSQTVTLADAVPPTIQCGTYKVVRQLGTRWNFDTPFASACGGGHVSVRVVNTVTNINDCAMDITRTWQATDAWGNSSLGSQTVTLVDMQPLNLLPLRAILSSVRPTNGMIPVTIEGTVTNACGVTAEYWIVSVTPVRILGQPNDHEITGARTLLLRAEMGIWDIRRTYEVTVAAKDPCGNTGTRTISVVVPGLP